MVERIVASKTVAQCRERLPACFRRAYLAPPVPRLGALPLATVVGAIGIFLALAFPVFISVAIRIVLERAVATLLMPGSVMPGLTIPVRNIATISRIDGAACHIARMHRASLG